MPRVVDAPPLPVEEDSCLETQHPPPPASIPVIPEDVAMHRAKLVELLEMAAPDRVASVDAFMAGFGDAEEMFDHLQAESGRTDGTGGSVVVCMCEKPELIVCWSNE